MNKFFCSGALCMFYSQILLVSSVSIFSFLSSEWVSDRSVPVHFSRRNWGAYLWYKTYTHMCTLGLWVSLCSPISIDFSIWCWFFVPIVLLDALYPHIGFGFLLACSFFMRYCCSLSPSQHYIGKRAIDWLHCVYATCTYWSLLSLIPL